MGLLLAARDRLFLSDAEFGPGAFIGLLRLHLHLDPPRPLDHSVLPLRLVRVLLRFHHGPAMLLERSTEELLHGRGSNLSRIAILRLRDAVIEFALVFETGRAWVAW